MFLVASWTAALAARTAEPVDVVFVLDNSGSMREHDPAFLTREAVLDFTAALAEQARVQAFEARVGIVLFDEDVTVALPLTPLSGRLAESTRAMLAPALVALDYSGQRTRSADGIERALYALRESKPEGGRQAIVFLTDGKLDTGDPARDREASAWLRSELTAEARSLGIRIFGLAFTERADYQLLQSVARQTDADYYRALRADELGEVAGRVLARLTRAPVAALPDVASPSPSAPAPAVEAPAARGFGRLAWLPVALLLIGGTLWGARRRLGAGRAARDASSRSPAAQLLDIGGVLGETGRAIPLAAGRTRIGRDPHNDLVIRDDTISSEHAVIELAGGRYWLEDLRSTNGTKHRDIRLAPGQRVPLKVGDHVRFADLDLMFVAPGHVPGGATVVLPSTSTPPSHWRSADRSTGGAGATGPAAPKPAVRDAARPLFDASTSELYREALDYHLDRVAELSPAFARFVARAFEEEMRAALCVAAAELVQTAQREDRIAERRYTQDRIRYVVCGAPGGMDVAARAHLAAHGGFSRFLTEQIDDASFRADRCEILAVLSFGRSAGAPWVTLSIVPDEGRDPQIDLLSFELLSEEERRAIQPDAAREVSQTGHA
jgi:pSer/pThr/pTyr-binding forkhead associated (FHA) protein/Mg-chelatase subunit ChlD